MKKDDKLITMKQASAILGCTWQTVRNYITIGRLKGVQINAVPANSRPRWAVSETEVRRLEEEHRRYAGLEATAYYTYSQAAAILSCTRPALDGAIARGWLTPVKLSVLCLEREAVEALYLRCAELITVKEAASIIGVSATMVQRYIEDGSLTSQPFPLGKRQRLVRADVQAFASTHRATKAITPTPRKKK